MQRIKQQLPLVLMILAAMALVAASACGGGGGGGAGSSTNITINTISSAADGLDLQAVGELLKEAKDAEALETALNKEGGVNNLDLDEDGNVDFIKVTEYGEGDSTGFSLTVDMGNGEEQELVTIDMVKTSDGNVDVEMQGNEQIYGENNYHHSRFGFSDYLLFSYMFSPHPFYYSPYGFGRYPGFYRPYGVMSRSAYGSRMSTVTKTSTMTKSSTSKVSSASKAKNNPNKGKSSSSVKAPLKSPTTSQKSFQKNNPSKSVPASKGFSSGKKSTTGTSAGKSGSKKSPSSGSRSSSSRSRGGK